jgi:hypothetical protein
MRLWPAVALALFVPAWISAQTVVDFENLPEGKPVAGQVTGMTFTNAQVLQSGASLNEKQFPPRSGAKVVADVGGPMQIVFANPVSKFTGAFTHQPGISLQALNGDGEVVDETSSPNGLNSPNESLSLNAEQGFVRVRIVSAPGGSSFTLDDAAVILPSGPRILPFTLSSESVTFTYSLGGQALQPAIVHVSSDTGVSVTVTSSATWFQVSPTLAKAPADIKITANPANLIAGTYSGVAVVSGGGATVPITVTLRILPPAELFSTPASLTFRYRQGDAAPAAQTFFVGLRNGATNLNYLITPKDSWIKVDPNSGQTGNLSKLISVTVDASKLTPGHYDSGVLIYADPTANSPLTVPISLDVLPKAAAQLIEPNLRPAADKAAFGGDPQ